MYKISMTSREFGENKIIERLEVCSPAYNTKISKPENCEVVIVAQEGVRRLKNIEGNILNPRKKSFFGKNRTDRNDYIVFFMDTAFHDASWGGNVQYVDERVGGVQEKINIRASFAFRITRGDRLLALLSQTQNEYSKRYLVDKIRLKIDNTIKAYVCEVLMSRGFIDTQQDLLKISESAQQKLNDDLLSDLGIAMSSLNIVLEEDSEHADQRGELEWIAIRKNNDIGE